MRYNYEFLTKIPYFEDYHKSISENKLKEDMSNVLDTLTGVIARRFIEGYAKYLISINEKFSIMISDLDNFKLINDTYGHATGDIVLEKIGEFLVNYVGDKGIVGRFGGDEFIIIVNGYYDYDNIRSFINEMYYNDTVYRKNFTVKDLTLQMTSTIGSTTFPHDGLTYDELFINMDKALYRGKTKGRNCFIIYLEEKHKDIDISKMKKKSIYEVLTTVSDIFKVEKLGPLRLNHVLKYAEKALAVDDAMFIDIDYYQKDINAKFPKDLFSQFDTNGIYACNDRTVLESNKEIFEVLSDTGILSFVIAKVQYKKEKIFGYIMLSSKHTQHIWQDEELAFVYYIAQMFSIEWHIKNI